MSHPCTVAPKGNLSLTSPFAIPQVMGISHPAIDTRDTSLFLPFRRSLRYKANVMIPLVTLVNQLMARNIGLHGEHPVSNGCKDPMTKLPVFIFAGLSRLNMLARLWTSSARQKKSGRVSSRPAHGPRPYRRTHTRIATTEHPRSTNRIRSARTPRIYPHQHPPGFKFFAALHDDTHRQL